LRKVGRTSYVLGLGVAPIAEGFRRQTGRIDLFTELCRQAAQRTGETSYVSGWVDDEIVVLATARGSAAVHAAEVPLGTAGDAHARASGKPLVAMSNERVLNTYLKTHPIKSKTPTTIKNRRLLDQELQRIAKSWVASDREEYMLGLSCLAVP